MMKNIKTGVKYCKIRKLLKKSKTRGLTGETERKIHSKAFTDSRIGIRPGESSFRALEVLNWK